MATIPTLSGSERPVTAAPLGAAERSLAGESAVLQGQRALSQGIGDVSRTAGNAALYMARVKNRADELRIEQTIRQEETEFRAFQESEPDETKWLEAASQRTNAVRERISAMKLAPEVAREAEARLEGWAAQRSVDVQTQADRYATKRHDEVLVREIATAADQGDKEYIDNLFDERVILGTVHADVAAAAKREAYERADVAQASRAMQEDPRMALERLEAQTDGGRWRNYKDLSETARLSLVRSAKNGVETLRAEHAQEISGMIFAGKVSGLDERLEYELKTGGLTAQTASNLRSFARGQRSPTDQAAAGAQLWQAAMELDPASPDFIQQNQRIRAQVAALDPAVRDPILDTLNAKTKNTVSEDTQKVFDLLNRDFRANTYGNVQTYTQAEIDKDKKLRKAGKREGDPKDPAGFEQASATLFRHQRAMRQFLQANPKASVSDIMTFRASLTATDTQAQLGQLAVDALTGAVVQ